MSTPESPDRSAAQPPAGPDRAPSADRPAGELVERGSRRPRRGLAVAGFATALAIGAVGTTAFVAQRSPGGELRLTSATSSATAPSDRPGDPDGDGDARRGGMGGGMPGMPGRHGGPGGLAMLDPRGALHGELVVPQQGGTGTQTVVVQSGTVTAVSAKSLSVKSTDGYTATYVIASTTRVSARSQGITSLKAGDSVHVLATKSGSTLTAVMVGSRDGLRPDGDGPRTAPSPSATGSTSSGSSSGSSSGTSDNA